MLSSDCTSGVFPLPRGGSIILHEVTGVSREALLKGLARLTSPRDRNGHPGPPRYAGPNPVSLERSSLQKLAAAAGAGTLVWGAEKTDGTRALLMACTLAGVKVCVAWTRRLSCHLLPLKGFSNAGFQGTVLDGEIVLNRQTGRMEFLVFDAVVAGGCGVQQRPFSGRIRAAQLILKQYKPCEGDPLTLKVKSFLPLNAGLFGSLRSLLTEQGRAYNCDGIVFMPEHTPVIFGRHELLLKWKMHHTLDFLVGDRGELSAYDTQTRAPRSVGKLVGGPFPPPGSIAECELVETGLWRLVEVRHDKSRANDTQTLSRTMTNILEAITLDQIEAVVCGGRPAVPVVAVQ